MPEPASISPDALDARPVEVGIVAEATPTDSPSVETPTETPAPAGGEKPAVTEPEKGPIPYERFHAVNSRKKELEDQLSRLGPIATIYEQLQADPRAAAAFADAVAQAMRGQPQTDPGLDESMMTETERALHQRVQHLESTVTQTVQSTEAAANAVAVRELSDATAVVERYAKEHGLPFDAERLTDAIDSLNVERLIGAGKTVEDIALLAFKGLAFDDLPEVVRKQTYAEQRKKAGASLESPASRTGTPVERVGSVRDAVSVAMKKLGLPDT